MVRFGGGVVEGGSAWIRPGQVFTKAGATMGTDSGPGGRVTVELWAWPDQYYTDEDHDLAIKRLDRLADEGRIDAYRIHTWPRQLDVSSPDPSDPDVSRARERIDRFRRWARRTGVRLTLPDPTRVGSGRMGPEFDALRLPPLVLAEFRDGALSYVAPCVEPDGGCSVEDRLDLIARRGTELETIG